MPLAGDLRHLVRLQRQTFTADGRGGYDRAWSDIGTVHAMVISTGGRELLHAGQLEYMTTFNVVLRWRGDLTPAQRVVWEDPISGLVAQTGITQATSRILDVLAATNEDGRHRWLSLSCAERIPPPGPA